MTQHCLMLGAGFSAPKKRMYAAAGAEQEVVWKTLDMNSACHPDEIFDLRQLEKGVSLPFPHGSFDEIHAYEILEHFGTQGDYQGLFSTFQCIWKALKEDGLLIGSCPALDSRWLWSEPGHRRVISEGTLAFLTKSHYEQLGHTSCSDYREHVDPCWWTLEHSEIIGNSYYFILKKGH